MSNLIPSRKRAQFGASTSATAADLSIQSNLLDDYFHTEDASVPSDLRGRFVVVQDLASNETASEIVTVNTDGEIVHFRPDPQSQSGWSKTTHRVSAPPGSTSSDVEELLAFYQYGQLNVVVFFPTARGTVPHWVQWDESSGWSDAPLDPDTQSAMTGAVQATVYRDSGGDCYIYGRTMGAPGTLGHSFVVAWNSSHMQWRWISRIQIELYQVGINQPIIRMAPGRDGAQFQYQWISNGVLYTDSAFEEGGTLYFGDPSLKHFVPRDPQVANLGFNPGWSISDIVPLPPLYARDSLLLHLVNGMVLLVRGTTQQDISSTILLGNAPVTNPLGGPDAAAVVNAGYFVDDSGANVLMLFGVDEDQANLWYLAQDLSTTADDPGFNEWTNLGATLNWVTCPTRMIHGPEMFTVTTDDKVKHLARTPSDPGVEGQTQVWVSQRLAQPIPSSAPPVQVAAYVMELFVTDANGAGVPSVVHATADHRATVVVDGLAYGLTPNAPMSFVTDTGGRVTVRMRSTDLTPPQITFRVGSDVERWCRGDAVEIKPGETDPGQPVESVASRLQNKDPSRAVTNQALATSEVIDGVKIGPLMGKNFDPAKDGDAASAIIASGAWLDPNNVNPDGTLKVDQLPIEHWELHFPPDGPATYRELTEEEGLAILTTARGTPRVQGLGKFFGDVTHFFKHAWNELTHFTATVERDAGGLLKSLKIVFNRVTEFTITTIKEAGAALETVFTRIAELAEEAYHAIQEVIKWLKMLFEWKDFVHTKNIIKACVVSTLQNVDGSIDEAKERVDEWFAKLKLQMRAGLEHVVAQPQFGDTFNGFVNGLSPSASSGNSLANPPNSVLYNQYHAKCNYVYSRSSVAARTSSAGQLRSAFAELGPAAGQASQNILDAFNRDVADQPQFKSGLATLEDYIVSAVSDPQMFFNQIMRALVSASIDVCDFVIGALDNVVDAVLDALEAAITGLIGTDGTSGVLGKRLHVPVISYIYEDLLEAGPLSLLDVICLGLALPGTIVYKLLNNGRAPFESITAQDIYDGLLPWPIDNVAKEPSPQVLAVRPDTLRVMGEFAGILQIFNGVLTALTDLISAEGGDDPAPDEIFVSACAWITNLGVTSLTTPATQLDNDNRSETDNMTITAWALGFLSLTTDAVNIYDKGQVVKMGSTTFDGILNLVGCGLNWTAGGMQIGDDEYSDWTVANSFISPLLGCFSWAIELGPYMPEIVAGTDLVVGIGSGLTQFESASKG